MANDNVREPFRSILASIVKPVDPPKPKPLTNRERFRVLEAIHYKLDEAGISVDIGTLDWICREFDEQTREADLDRQYRYELARRSGGIMPDLHDSDSEPKGRF